MAQAAINKGLTEIAITDHTDFSYPELVPIDNSGLAENVRAVRDLQMEFAGRIDIKVGAELGLRPDTTQAAAKIISEHDFDFIIGSTHDYFGMGFHNQNFFALKSKIEAYNIYFENMLATIAANVDNFDVLGHMDYIERYPRGYRNKTLKYREHHEIIDKILTTLVEKGKGIEINTAGFAYGLGRAHPNIDILRRYVQLGGEIITIGSDAHFADRVGQYFKEAQEMLAEVGITHIASFTKRKATMVKI